MYTCIQSRSLKRGGGPNTSCGVPLCAPKTQNPKTMNPEALNRRTLKSQTLILRGGRVLLTEIPLPRIAGQGTLCLIATGGQARQTRIEQLELEQLELTNLSKQRPTRQCHRGKRVLERNQGSWNHAAQRQTRVLICMGGS